MINIRNLEYLPGNTVEPGLSLSRSSHFEPYPLCRQRAVDLAFLPPGLGPGVARHGALADEISL